MIRASLLVAALTVVLNAQSNDVVLNQPGYRVTVAREGFQLRVERSGKLLLESGPQNLAFERNGKRYTVAKLTSVKQDAGRTVLEYDTTLGDAIARIELTPNPISLRITTALLHSDGDLTPVISYRMADAGFWYGGGFQGWRSPQIIPLNEARLAPRWFLAEGNTQGTPAWYTTNGVGVWVRTPLDFRYSVNDGGNGLFTIEMPGASSVTHDILIGTNIRATVDRIIREIGLPKTAPPADYFRLPIYTTWVEHKVPVSQEKVLEYARAIRKSNLPAGVIEIDDKWEDSYGDMNFDTSKFPDPKALVDELHKMNFRVTLWVHPFVNTDSQTYAKSPRLLLADASGKPGLIKWWNGIAAVWDYTNPKAADEFRSRLRKLQAFGIDGFKFDGGDVNLVPRDMQAYKAITPAEYPDVYNREATAHFAWEETRVGVLSQPLGVVQRLIDKHSTRGKENGLAAIVPEAITVSMRGFAYVMPDMIGGNQYDGDKIDKELMIRWAQASALMPLIQFSVGPWHFDEETVRLCREASDLHTAFADYIIELANSFPKTGEPILRPIWYNYPDDTQGFPVTDEYMVGADVLVAPVLEKGATKRRVYVPQGTWTDERGTRYEGRRWIENYSAPLDTLPVFVRAPRAFPVLRSHR